MRVWPVADKWLKQCEASVHRPTAWLRIAASVAVFALLWLDLVWLPTSPVMPWLDVSWCGALIHFTAQRLQYGTDIIFTYGPLAYLNAFVYTGELFTQRIVWEFVSKTAFAAVLTITVMRLPLVWRAPFFLFVLLFIWADPISDALHFLVFASLTAMLLVNGIDRRVLNVATALLLAVCSLIKFTYFILALFILLVLTVRYCTNRRPLKAALLCGTYSIAFLAAWKWAGQTFATLVPYLRMSLEVCVGYKDAMSAAAKNDIIVALGVTAVLLVLALCSLIVFDRPSSLRASAALFILGTSYLGWNRAFIRADDHVLSFFAIAPVLALVIWTIGDVPRPLTRNVGYGVNIAIFACCLAGLWLQKPSIVTNCFVDTTARFRGAFAVLTETRTIREQLDEQLAAARETFSLPRAREMVGNHTLDVFGSEQGIALLNSFNYTPRLVFQSYSAYTPALIAANTEFYRSSHAPEFVLLKCQPIDGRFPALEDAGVLREILSHYSFQFEEKGYSLWKRSSATEAEKPNEGSEQVVRIGTEVPVPSASAVWVQISVERSFRGALRAALYKSPEVYLRTLDDAGETRTHRLIPGMASSGFLISPLLTDASQLPSAAAGTASRKIVAFSVRVPKPDRKFFRKELTVRMTPLPRFFPGQPAVARLDAGTNHQYFPRE